MLSMYNTFHGVAAPCKIRSLCKTESTFSSLKKQTNFTLPLADAEIGSEKASITGESMWYTEAKKGVSRYTGDRTGQENKAKPV
jgi:hypothetical protein